MDKLPTNYILQEIIGTGSSSKVYKAYDSIKKKYVAIKVISKEWIFKSNMEKHIMNEISIHSTLHHKNILKFIDCIKTNEFIYLIFELCKNGTLCDYLNKCKEKKLNEKKTILYISQIIKGIQYLHGKNLIHRDLKLSNILLTDDYNCIKISDFGLAKKLLTDIEGASTICGTPNFLAPEILKNCLHKIVSNNENEIESKDNESFTQENIKFYSYSVDIWSLGCITYCLLVGKPPFQGKKVSNTLENIMEASNNLSFPSYISENAMNFIKKMLISDPFKRPGITEISKEPWIKQSIFEDNEEIIMKSRMIKNKPNLKRRKKKKRWEDKDIGKDIGGNYKDNDNDKDKNNTSFASSTSHNSINNFYHDNTKDMYLSTTDSDVITNLMNESLMKLEELNEPETEMDTLVKIDKTKKYSNNIENYEIKEINHFDSDNFENKISHKIDCNHAFCPICENKTNNKKFSSIQFEFPKNKILNNFSIWQQKYIQDIFLDKYIDCFYVNCNCFIENNFTTFFHVQLHPSNETIPNDKKRLIHICYSVHTNKVHFIYKNNYNETDLIIFNFYDNEEINDSFYVFCIRLVQELLQMYLIISNKLNDNIIYNKENNSQMNPMNTKIYKIPLQVIKRSFQMESFPIVINNVSKQSSIKYEWNDNSYINRIQDIYNIKKNDDGSLDIFFSDGDFIKVDEYGTTISYKSLGMKDSYIYSYNNINENKYPDTMLEKLRFIPRICATLEELEK